MKVSIVMTVFNRPEIMLINTLAGLLKNDLKDTEIIIVDDGSTVDYGHVKDCFEDLADIKWLECDTLKARPDTYQIDGFNNPAYAFNEGFEAAEGDVIYAMSSDVIVPPNTLGCSAKHDLRKGVWYPRVVDMDTGMEYLGMSRIFPVQFFMGTHRDNWGDRPFDEEYLKGIAFEDNDLAATVGLKVGKLIIDTDITAYHQSHAATAYSDNLEGWKINLKYTNDKWGAVPFDGKSGPVGMEATTVAGTLFVKTFAQRKLEDGPRKDVAMWAVQ